jgi:hypothetical protein
VQNALQPDRAQQRAAERTPAAVPEHHPRRAASAIANFSAAREPGEPSTPTTIDFSVMSVLLGPVSEVSGTGRFRVEPRSPAPAAIDSGAACPPPDRLRAAVAAVDAEADADDHIPIDVRAIRISSRVDVDDARPADAPAASSEPVQVRPMDSHRRARCRPKGTSLALVLVWPRTRLELRLRRAVARGEGGEFRSCRWQCPSMIRLGVYRGSWSMGFVIQMAAGKAEAEPHTGRTRPGRQRSRRAAGREDRDQDPRDTAQWLALGVVTRWSPFGQPARSPVGAVSTDSEALATTGSATGADSADPLGRTTMTGQRACSTHWRLTEPSNMLAKPPRPR